MGRFVLGIFDAPVLDAPVLAFMYGVRLQKVGHGYVRVTRPKKKEPHVFVGLCNGLHILRFHTNNVRFKRFMLTTNLTLLFEKIVAVGDADQQQQQKFKSSCTGGVHKAASKRCPGM